MESEISLSRSRYPAICSYTEPDQLHAQTISWIFILILSSHLRLGLPSGFFPRASQPKFCTHLSSLWYVPQALRISFFLIWSPE